jgi:hypothetical protein
MKQYAAWEARHELCNAAASLRLRDAILPLESALKRKTCWNDGIGLTGLFPLIHGDEAS